MKRSSIITLFFLLSVPGAHANEAVPSYVELPDAPTIAVDWSRGRTQTIVLHGNRTVTFSNGRKGEKYLLIVRQDDTGSRTLKWPQSVHWPGVFAPTLTTTADRKDYIIFFYDGLSYDALGFTQNL
jgi:hypothetical protein